MEQLTREEILKNNALVDQKKLADAEKLFDDLKRAGIPENQFGLTPVRAAGASQVKTGHRLATFRTKK